MSELKVTVDCSQEKPPRVLCVIERYVGENRDSKRQVLRLVDGVQHQLLLEVQGDTDALGVPKWEGYRHERSHDSLDLTALAALALTHAPGDAIFLNRHERTGWEVLVRSTEAKRIP